MCSEVRLKNAYLALRKKRREGGLSSSARFVTGLRSLRPLAVGSSVRNVWAPFLDACIALEECRDEEAVRLFGEVVSGCGDAPGGERHPCVCWSLFNLGLANRCLGRRGAADGAYAAFVYGCGEMACEDVYSADRDLVAEACAWLAQAARIEEDSGRAAEWYGRVVTRFSREPGVTGRDPEVLDAAYWLSQWMAQGNPCPDSVGGCACDARTANLGGILVLSLQAAWQREWERCSEAAAQFLRELAVVRGERRGSVEPYVMLTMAHAGFHAGDLHAAVAWSKRAERELSRLADSGSAFLRGQAHLIRTESLVRLEMFEDADRPARLAAPLLRTSGHSSELSKEASAVLRRAEKLAGIVRKRLDEDADGAPRAEPRS